MKSMKQLKAHKLLLMALLAPLTACTYFSETVYVEPQLQRYWSSEGRGTEIEIRVSDARKQNAVAKKPALIGRGGDIHLEKDALNKLRTVTENAFRLRQFAVSEVQACELLVDREEFENEEKSTKEIEREYLAAKRECHSLRSANTQKVYVSLQTLKYQAVEEFWGSGNTIVAEFLVETSTYQRRFQVLQGGSTDFGRGRAFIDRDMSRVFSEFVRQMSSDVGLIRMLTRT